MEEEVPQNVKTAAILQLVSGLLNVFVMGGVSYFVFSMVGGIITGICTLGMFPIGVLCGALGCLLIPIGILEVVSGILGMTNPKSAGTLMRITSFVEMGSLLAGGLLSCIAGGVAFTMMRDPEAAAFLEG